MAAEASSAIGSGFSCRSQGTLGDAIVLPGRKSDFFRTATGKAPKSALRPAEGRPEGQFRCVPGSSPATIRRGVPIYGPEALLRNTPYDEDGPGSRCTRLQGRRCSLSSEGSGVQGQPSGTTDRSTVAVPSNTSSDNISVDIKCLIK